MKRREFIKNSAWMGMGMTFLSSLLSSCKTTEQITDIEVNFSGKVLIIGAGASGLMAAYMLNQYNIDFEIIEASSVFGGRVKKIDSFADFPIDLGAEWIHDSPSIFASLINDDQVEGNIELIPYSPNSLHGWNKNKLHIHNWASTFYAEYKFKNTTWYDFLATYIAPNILHKISYNSPVQTIDYTGQKVIVTDTNNKTYEGDKVLVTVPSTILQSNSIQFNPKLPSDKTEVLKNLYTPDGIKVFIEFSEHFYPDILLFGPLIGDDSQEKIFYDAAFKKDSTKNILGLFCIGDQATEYVNLGSEQAVLQRVLSELDTIYDGKASQYYVKHIVQDWSNEPYIKGSYTHHYNANENEARATLRAAINKKVYFAGEAYSDYAPATVHGAGLSAYEAITTILKGT